MYKVVAGASEVFGGERSFHVPNIDDFLAGILGSDKPLTDKVLGSIEVFLMCFPQFQNRFGRSIYVDECTLEEHTRLALTMYLANYGKCHSISDQIFFVKLLLIHDIGKPRAKAMQHIVTLYELNENVQGLFSEVDNRFAQEIIGGPLGTYMSLTPEG
jgi:hypothetical protein